MSLGWLSPGAVAWIAPAMNDQPLGRRLHMSTITISIIGSAGMAAAIGSLAA